MEKALEDYEKLKEQGKDIYTLSSILMLLEWDQETKTHPTKALLSRH